MSATVRISTLKSSSGTSSRIRLSTGAGVTATAAGSG
jgi:hypothetical protein